MMLHVYNALSIISLKGQVMHFYVFPQDPETATRNPLSQKHGGGLFIADLYLKTSLFLTKLIMALSRKTAPKLFQRDQFTEKT